MDRRATNYNKSSNIEDGSCAIDDRRSALAAVEGQLRKIRAEREKIEADMLKDENTMEVTRQKIETQYKKPADQVVKEMKDEQSKAQVAQLVRRPSLRRQDGLHPAGRASCSERSGPLLRRRLACAARVSVVASRPRLSVRQRRRAFALHRRRSTKPTTSWRTTRERVTRCSSACGRQIPALLSSMTSGCRRCMR